MKYYTLISALFLSSCQTIPVLRPGNKSSGGKSSGGNSTQPSDLPASPTFGPEDTTHILPFITIVLIILGICVTPFIYKAVAPYPPKFFKYVKKKIDQKLDKSLK